jgi:signal transduction histidine kinase
MKAPMSLRARLLLGAILWTLGLFTAIAIVMTVIVYTSPRAPRFFHHLFSFSPLPVAFAVLCLVGGLRLVRQGVSPIRQLRTRLAGVHAGREPRVDGDYPSEVQPLVDDLNALLAQREQMVERAQAKAGDLAHGLKTPLAVLTNEAARAEAAGHADLAATIREQVDRMRRQAEYHLAHARAAAGGRTLARASVRDAVEALARTLDRLHAERGVTIDHRVPADHQVRGQRADVDEMLGNLLDNACKWARSRVTVTSALAGDDILITVDDDGPGLDPSKRDLVLQRGARADEASAGSGLGLAIVREIAELHGGSITLDRAPTGGLRAVLRLPAR